MAEFINNNIRKLENGELLSELEINVFDIFSKTCSLFNNKKVVARVAGGWVRDKLLGGESDDIDFALENASGEEFALKMKEIADIKLQLNPAQSQQLESAKVCLFNSVWIDICQLRCDEYSENSRIPTIRIGTPYEDSVRRDITINCLYFNINTKKVEDLCDGIPDLIGSVARTPIDPFLSFGDDPLRILRTFRFASRFNLTVSENIMKAASSRLKELQTKVTHPRIEMELHKALNGPDPFNYIKRLIDSNLFYFIFDEFHEWNLNEQQVIERTRISKEIISNLFNSNNSSTSMINFANTFSQIFNNADNRYSIALATVYYSLADFENVPDPVKKSKNISALECAIVRRIHATLDVFKCANKTILASKSLDSIINNVNRVTVGQWLMNVGEFWPLSYSICFDNAKLSFFENILIPFIEAEKLDGVWKLKPIIDGKTLATIHGVKPGPMIAKLTKELIDWQLANPTGTVEDYKTFVTTSK
ncbi:polyA polymerase family protein [Tritrichomonas foetus]|uniref:PolyA polymerase family protein n=1 Tax=Tritrichomonas foetus TaxID=1144522 RepID=A0A1J4K8T0_9EUKA|nr:polyA polymerase family protein [Tritrichomonas foetus]|eukprot:OHT07619.1 polyA polymerase family protein [Tritrichomonas foetus]